MCGAAEVVLEAVGLTKIYSDRPVVRGVDLELRAGEILGFIGPNGAGKTTTWSMLTGLLEPSRGYVRVLGEVPTPESVDLKRRIGVVPDESRIFPRLSGEELLWTFGRLYGLERGRLCRRMDEILALLELDQARSAGVSTYSRGMRKKLSIAAAVMHEPEVLFLDEPFAGMDVAMVRIVMRILVDMAARGCAIFLTSHLLDYLERLATRIALIHEGRILLSCASADLDRHRKEIAGAEGDAGRLESLILGLSGDLSTGSLSWLGDAG